MYAFFISKFKFYENLLNSFQPGILLNQSITLKNIPENYNSTLVLRLILYLFRLHKTSDHSGINLKYL